MSSARLRDPRAGFEDNGRAPRKRIMRGLLKGLISGSHQVSSLALTRASLNCPARL